MAIFRTIVDCCFWKQRRTLKMELFEGVIFFLKVFFICEICEVRQIGYFMEHFRTAAPEDRGLLKTLSNI